MILYRISITLFIILIFSSIFQINDSEHIENEDYITKSFENQMTDNYLHLESSDKLTPDFEGRAGLGGSSGSFNTLNDMFGRFWHTLYVNRAFNSSFVLLLPLFTITIPGYGRGIPHQTPLSALNVGNLAIFGILVFGSIALWAPILYPDFSFGAQDGGFRSLNEWEDLTKIMAKRLLLLTEQIIGRALEVDDKELKVNNFLTSRLHSIVDFIMKNMDKLLDDLPEYPGLHPQECVKRCICESYKTADRYGRVGKIIKFLFRPYQKLTKSEKTVSKYRLAANYGLKEKSIDCGHRFNGCYLNFPHILHHAIKFLF